MSRYVSNDMEESGGWRNRRSFRDGMLLCTVFAEQTIQRLLLSDGKLTGLDTGVIDTQERVDVVHGLCPDISELLDFGGGVLDLLIGQL